jgi:hypothetical protein
MLRASPAELPFLVALLLPHTLILHLAQSQEVDKIGAKTREARRTKAYEAMELVCKL